MFLNVKNKTLERNIKQNNPYLVLVRGPLGVGKSTISTMLAGILNAEYISIDKVLEDHKLDDMDESVGCIHVNNFLEANTIALPDILTSLRREKNVIVDGNFYYKEALMHLIDSIGAYPSYVFTLKCPLEVCVERDSSRAISHGFIEAKAVHKLVSRFDYGICLDTENQIAEETVKEIMTYLPE